MAAQSDDILKLLRSSEIFSTLPDDGLRRLADGSEIKTCDAGQVIVSQGEIGDFAGLVLSGAANVVVETNGAQVAVAQVPRGGVFGEIAAFSTVPRTASVIAVEPVEYLKITQSVVLDLIAQDPALSASVIGQLGGRLQGLNTVFAALTQSAQALADDTFQRGMLSSIHEHADRYGLFADTFEALASEIQRKRAVASEMALAGDIQQSFLPQRLNAGEYADHFDLAAKMVPAAQVGGDFYDYFFGRENQLFLVVGDVSGKGVPASIFMSMARTVIKTIAREDLALRDVMARVNDVLAEDNTEAMFVTLAIAEINLSTGAASLVSAGHEEVYFVPQAKGVLRQFGANGPAAGLFEGAKYDSVSLDLAEGDCLCFATDGVTEALNADNHQFSAAATENVIQNEVRGGPDHVVSTVFETVSAFANGRAQSDDITALAFQFRGRR